MPLLDPRLQNVIRKFPELVMAGACLPDLAIISHRFRHTHLWENAHHLLQAAQTDEETAIAIGYASHLYIDVIAHNHFVPAHEAMWFKTTIVTHVTSEWAMDAYLSPLMDTSPHLLITKHLAALSKFISLHFRCSEKTTRIALRRLAIGDRFLRMTKLPHAIHAAVRLLDKRINTHFIYYIAKTQAAMKDVGEVLNGNRPLLEPELKNISMDQLENWRAECLMHLKLMHPEPIKYFMKQAN